MQLLNSAEFMLKPLKGRLSARYAEIVNLNWVEVQSKWPISFHLTLSPGASLTSLPPHSLLCAALSLSPTLHFLTHPISHGQTLCQSSLSLYYFFTHTSHHTQATQNHLINHTLTQSCLRHALSLTAIVHHLYSSISRPPPTLNHPSPFTLTVTDSLTASLTPTSPLFYGYFIITFV